MFIAGVLLGRVRSRIWRKWVMLRLQAWPAPDLSQQQRLRFLDTVHTASSVTFSALIEAKTFFGSRQGSATYSRVFPPVVALQNLPCGRPIRE